MNLLAPLVAAHLALAAAPSVPVHLCLAVDRSATMAEHKAAAARQAALEGSGFKLRIGSRQQRR